MAKKKATRKRYSDQDRAAALAALAANGGNLQRTARQVGIPETTLRHWAGGMVHPEVAKDGDQKKKDMADSLERVAWQLLEAAPDKIKGASLAQTFTALGIAVDKMRLLRNQPTDITRGEFGDLTDEQLDREIADLEGRVSRPAAREGRAGRPH